MVPGCTGSAVREAAGPREASPGLHRESRHDCSHHVAATSTKDPNSSNFEGLNFKSSVTEAAGGRKRQLIAKEVENCKAHTDRETQ
ncbi:hypothetical protein ATANTOWER_012872, partial [Ataeniobius toweri]|nr:hypothetical protein [Ataeniobius toweri]